MELLNVDEFMEKDPFRKRDVRYDYIEERDGVHLNEIWQVRVTQARQHGVKRRIFDPDTVKDKDPHIIEHTGQEETSHCRPLRWGEGRRLTRESLPLRSDVLSDKG